MDQGFYQTSQFAKKASVSERTLRYYDKVGLLSPSCRTEASYRLYTDADFLRLQRILALKFLGLSLDEIRQCLRTGPSALRDTLALQKAMMQERRAQLDAIILAINETEATLETNQCDWDSIIRVIRVIQMTQEKDWWKKYYSEGAIKKLEERAKTFTAEDQREVEQRWNVVFAELKRLVSAHQDPACAEAQAIAKEWLDLTYDFHQGDPEIMEGARKLYETPPGEKPFCFPFSKEEEAYIGKAIKIYQQERS